MTQKKNNITSAELMSQLSSDPEFLAQKAEKDLTLQTFEKACKEDESELVTSLKNLGLEVSSVWDLVNNIPHKHLEREFTGSYEIAYPLLVAHLKLPHHPRVREGIIRALTEKNAKDIASAVLLDELSKETDQSLRWVIANALLSMLSISEIESYPEIEESYKHGYL